MGFRFYFPAVNHSTRNFVPTLGARDLLRMLFRGDETYVPIAGNFFLGLCDQVPAEGDELPDITSEPTIGTNGYARQAIARSAIGFPTELVVSAASGVRALEVSFGAVGGDFDAPISRAFLTDQSTGFTGALFAYSGALTNAITIQDATSFPVQFGYFLD